MSNLIKENKDTQFNLIEYKAFKIQLRNFFRAEEKNSETSGLLPFMDFLTGDMLKGIYELFGIEDAYPEEEELYELIKNLNEKDLNENQIKKIYFKFKDFQLDDSWRWTKEENEEYEEAMNDRDVRSDDDIGCLVRKYKDFEQIISILSAETLRQKKHFGIEFMRLFRKKYTDHTIDANALQLFEILVYYYPEKGLLSFNDMYELTCLESEYIAKKTFENLVENLTE